MVPMASPPLLQSALDLAESATQRRVVRALVEMAGRRSVSDDAQVPSERALCRTFSVSRPTVRQVLRELEGAGLVRSISPRRRVFTAEAIASAAGRSARSAAREAAGGGSGVMARTVVIVGRPVVPTDIARNNLQSLELFVMRELQQAGLHALVMQAEQLTGEHEADLVRHRPRGFVLMRDAVEGQSPLARVQRLVEQQARVVVFGQARDVPFADTVGTDHEAGGYLVTRALLRRGVQRVLAFWGLRAEVGSERPWLERREAGCRRACAEAGLVPLMAVRVVTGATDHRDTQRYREQARIAAGHLVEHLAGDGRVDGIVTTTDAQAALVAEAVRLCGLTPGHDVLIAGYDNQLNDEVFAQFPHRPAVTADQNLEACGAALARRLIADAPGAEPTHELITPQLLELDR